MLPATSFIISLDEIPAVVELLYSLMPEIKIFAFIGHLGAGKTTIIRSLLKKCGIIQNVSSPTYTYVNVYSNKDEFFYHFDLYRIGSVNHFIQEGFNELLYKKDSWFFIEWPEIIEPLLPKDITCFVVIEYVDHDKRSITISYKPSSALSAAI